MSTLLKRRIAILVSIVLVFAVACLSELTKGGIFLTAFAAEPTYAEVGTASLSDAGNTLFIRMAKFNVGTEEEPEIRYCSGFTVGNLGPEDNPTQNVNMDVLTPIWPDAPLTGTLDKDIYICGGADSVTADLYVNGLTQTEGHKLTAAGSFDVKMGALSVGEMIAPTVGVNIGDNASVTVNGNASVNYLWMYKPSRDNLEEGQADPATYNPQYLGGTLHVIGDLSGGSEGYIYIDGGSAATVDGNVSGLNNNAWQCIQVSNEGSLTVGGGISVPGGVAISNSALSVTEGVSAQNVVVNGGSAMNVGGDLSGGQIWTLGSTFTVGGSVDGSDVYFHGLPETATVGGKVTANNLWVYGTGDASTSKTALTVTGDISVSAYLDINSCATVTADDVICNYLYMEEAGPNVLNATTFKCTSDSCLYKNSTLNVTGDCTLDTPLFNVQGDSHVNVGGDLTVKNFIDVQDKSSLTVEGDVSFTEAYIYQLQAFGSGVITCKGNVAAKGAVSALRGGKIAVTGTLSSTDALSMNAMGSGSEITAGVIDAKTVNAISGGKIAVAGKLSATDGLSVNAMWGGSEITADAIDAEGCVSAIGNARVSVTGTLTTGDLGSLGVLAIGKDAVVEAENINAPYINALGYYSGAGGSGTSAVIVRKDANLSQWPVVDDGGTISVGGDLNCSSFSIYKQSSWNSEYTGWIRVGGDMSYAMNSGDISRGELTVGGDFINTAPNPGYGDGLAVYGGKLNVGGNVEFGSLLLNTRGDNTPLNVTGRINAARITDIIAKDANDEPLKLHTIAPFQSATANDEGFIPYQQPWYTQYVLLEDDSGNSYRADVSDLTKTSYSAVPATPISLTCVLNDRADWKYDAPGPVGYSGMTFKLPTGEDMTYTDGVYALTGWSANADGSGIVYAPGESVTLNGDSTFYALWSYCVNTPEPIVAGTVTAQAAAAPGDTVVLTITPGENYAIGSVSYSYNDGTDDHTVSVDPADGAYSFVMPEHGVSVSATWKKCLTHADISVEIPSAVYTGEVLSPTVTVKDGDQTLVVNSDYTVALPEGRINAGDYTVTVSAAENSASYSGSVTATFSITPASVNLTANSDTKTYTGEAYTVEGFTPSVEGLTFAETVKASGSGTNAGAYDVTFTGVTLNETKDTTGNYVVTGMTDGKLTIDKAAPVDVTVPTAKTLTYSGSAQALVTAGTATGGEMQYALGTATGATEPYTTSIPAKTEAGTYYVWYMVKGDANHLDREAKCVEVTILAEISNTVTFKVINGSWDDGTKEDKIVTLKGHEGDTLKLASSDIPKVGSEPDDKYKAGSWDTEPSEGIVITEDKVFTYKYVEEEQKEEPKDETPEDIEVTPEDDIVAPEEDVTPEDTDVTPEDDIIVPEDDTTPEDDVVPEDDKSPYRLEWVDGQWYDSEGNADYEPQGKWYQDDTGWWYEDESGWYPVERWQKIDGKWYYFTCDGYMDYSEYRDGYWLGADGAWDERNYGGKWYIESDKFWYQDESGWRPYSQWLWINWKCYYFDSDGYRVRNQYIDGYWVNNDGEWEP